LEISVKNIIERNTAIMREFIVTVNGNTYEVQVEEISEKAKTIPEPFAKTPIPKAIPIPNPNPAQKPEIKPLSDTNAGKITVKSPIPGIIVKINAKVGDAVKTDTVLCLLEAMKMENEIFAGTEGVIASVEVSAGTNVNSGDLLFTIN
jgi:glutaconyl-CoA decarboxylase